jgi:uncharacterized protein YvpB
MNQTDNPTPLLSSAQMAVRRGRHDEARRLFKAALRHDPTNADALLGLVYVAEDGQAGLHYLAQLLDAHPHHPQAQVAIRWARRRAPTSPPSPPTPRPRVPSSYPRRTVYGRAALILLLGLAAIWLLSQPAAESAPSDAPGMPLSASAPSHTPRPFTEIIRVAIPRFTPTASPIPTPTPDHAWVPVLGQPQSRNLSCESRSAADLASHWGQALDELDFLTALGQSDNPHQGFLGDVDMPPGSMPPDGYGVYAEPVAAVLRQYNLDARAVYDLGLERLKSELLAGRPVLVWATYEMAANTPREWVSSDGQSSTVVPFMHTFLAIGFDAQGLFLLDAYDATTQQYPYDVFMQVWNLFDQMAVVVSGTLP